MKRQDLDKYHNQSASELNEVLVGLQKSLQEAHLELRLNRQKNVHLTKSLRTDIARLKTIIHAKTLAQNTSSAKVTHEVKSLKPTKKQTGSKKES